MEASRTTSWQSDSLSTAEGDRDFYSLCLMPDRVLEGLMRSGTCPDRALMDGFDYRGYNTADITGILPMRKFMKGFYGQSEAQTEETWGYNVAVELNRIVDPWIQKEAKGGGPARHSYFRVYPVRDGEKDNLYPNSLLLNYASPKTRFNPARLLRDYLVQPFPENPDILLGKAYAALGPKRLFVSFFVIEKSLRAL